MSPATRSKVETPVACECVGITDLIKDIKMKLETCYEIILEQSFKMSEMQKEITVLKENKQTESACVQSTYAEIVSKQDHVLVVKPRQEKEMNKVKEDLRSNIDPVDLQVGLNIDRNTRNGGIILKCTNSEALNTVKNNIKTKMGEEYEIQVPKKLNPRIIVTGIDEEELQNEAEVKELSKKIIKQNRIPQGVNFRFEGIRKTKTRKGRFNLIVDVDPGTFNYLMNRDQILYIGWNNCNIYEYFSVRRCFKCGGYNHEAKDCKEKITCVLCAGEHTSDICRSGNKKCVNCTICANQKLNLNLDVQHAAIDRKCECYLRIVESIKKKTAYNE